MDCWESFRQVQYMKVLITSNSFGKFDEAPRERMLDLGWELLDNRYHHIMSEEEMMKVRNLGKKSLEEVEQKLVALGLALKNPEE